MHDAPFTKLQNATQTARILRGFVTSKICERGFNLSIELIVHRVEDVLCGEFGVTKSLVQGFQQRSQRIGVRVPVIITAISVKRPLA